MAPGQRVFFWLARKGGGLVAAGEILSATEEQAAPEWQLPYWMPVTRPDAGRIESRVRVRYALKFGAHPLTRDFLKLDPILATQQLIGPVYVGTNFAMSADAVRALEARLGSR